MMGIMMDMASVKKYSYSRSLTPSKDANLCQSMLRARPAFVSGNLK